MDKSILSSDFIIQNGCSSAIESLLLNVPCISYVPQEWSEDELAEFPNSLGIKAKNHEQVKKIIKSNIVKSSISKKKLKERYFFKKDNYAYERQVRLFEKIAKKGEKFEPSIKFKLKFLIKKIIQKITNKKNNFNKSPIEHKFPAFENKKIKNLINEISIITNKKDYKNTKINIISERFLFLKK